MKFAKHLGVDWATFLDFKSADVDDMVIFAAEQTATRSDMDELMDE